MDAESIIARLTADEVLATGLRNQTIQQGRGFFRNPDEEDDSSADEEELVEIASAEAKKVAREQREDASLGVLQEHLAKTQEAEFALLLLRASLLVSFVAFGVYSGSLAAASPVFITFMCLHAAGTLTVLLCVAPAPLSDEKATAGANKLLRGVELFLKLKDAVGKLIGDTCLLFAVLVLIAALARVSGVPRAVNTG